MLGWGVICPSKPAYYIVDSRILELVVWTKDNFSGSYSRLSFLFSGFFYFEVFCRTYLLTRYDLFFQLFCEFCSKNTRFSSPFHICTESSLSNREEKKYTEKTAPQRCIQFLWKDENQVLQLLHNALCNIFR